MEGGDAAYTVTRYDCGNPDDTASVKGLAALATAQQDVLLHPNPDNVVYLTRLQRRKFIQPFDSRVLPWSFECDYHTKKVDIRHYVAQMPNGTICGWMTAHKKTRFESTYIYLSEISTIRVRKAEYAGVADALLGRLRKDAEEEKVDFIYLYPLRLELKAVYAKRGYSSQPELFPDNNRYTDVRHMFLFIEGTKIPDMMLIRLKPNGGGEVIADAEATLLAMKDSGAALLKKLRKVHLNLKADKNLIEELRNANDNIGLFAEAGTPMTDDEKLASISEVVDVVPEKGPEPKKLQPPTRGNPEGIPVGGRRTRRFKMPRLMTKKYCKKTPCRRMGFTQRASCRPYKNCYTRRRLTHNRKQLRV
jgi:hypothetical protein